MKYIINKISYAELLLLYKNEKESVSVRIFTRELSVQTITRNMAAANNIQHKRISFMFVLFNCRDKINDSGLQSSMIKCKLYIFIRLYVFVYYRKFVFFI